MAKSPNDSFDWEERIFQGFLLSVAAHAVVILSFYGKDVFFPTKPIDYTPTLRVDVVALPDILKKDLHKVKAGEKKTKKPVPKKEVSKKPKNKAKSNSKNKKPKKKVTSKRTSKANRAKTRKKEMSAALAKLEAFDKLDDVAEPKDRVIKGNKVSPGTTLTGNAREAAEASYFDHIHDQIKSNWTLPVWLARQELSARVRIQVDDAGYVQGIQVEESSGDQQFDDAVKASIRKSEPFNAPPSEIREVVRVDGILLGFPL